MFRTLAAFALALACALPASATPAAPPAPPAAERFFQPPAMREQRLSPSGRRLAVSTEVRGRVGLFVIDLQAADFQASRAALFHDTDIRHFQWVDDERLVFSVVDLQLGLGEDYRVAPGLFAVRFDGKELRTLVERHGRGFVTTGERVNTLPWNHQLLLVPAAGEDAAGVRADEVVVGELDYDGKDLRSVTPHWLNTRTGRLRSMQLIGMPPGVLQWWFTPQGQPRAALSRHKGLDRLHWFHLPEDGQPGHWQQLAEAPIYKLPFRPLWVGQGQQLYITHQGGPVGESQVAAFDFARLAPGRNLLEAPGFDFAGELLGDAKGERLLGIRVDTDAEQTIWYDASHRALQALADEALPGRSNRISCRRCDADDAVMLVHSWSDRHPGQLLLWRKAAPAQKRWQIVSTQQPGIDPKRMASLDLVRIQARDGRELPVWITKPAGFEPGQPHPAVVMVHGGPWVRHGHWRWDPVAQFLASRGYLVIEPEFRGSDGYGAAHLQAGNKQWGQAMQDDVADALLWAQKEKLASSQACILGASYGGYSTLMGLIRHPELYRCGSAWVAVTDLMLFLEGGWFVSDDIGDVGRRHGLPERVGHADHDSTMLLANSPVAQAHRISAPLQLIWGSQDLRVPIAHGERLRSAMKKAGREPEWVVYAGEAHGWRKLENKVDMALKFEAFLARHLQPN